MNLDGSLDDDDEKEADFSYFLCASWFESSPCLAWTFLCRSLRPRGNWKRSCSQLIVHFITFITIRLPISCQDSRRLKSIYITWSNNLKTCRLYMVEDLWPKTWKEGECYHFGKNWRNIVNIRSYIILQTFFLPCLIDTSVDFHCCFGSIFPLKNNDLSF